MHGHAYDSTTGHPLAGVAVHVGSKIFYTDVNGYYIGRLLPDIHTIVCAAENYGIQARREVDISPSELLETTFALRPLSLTDAVSVLRILSGTAPSSPVYTEADVDGDGRIGMAEVIFVLRKISDL